MTDTSTPPPVDLAALRVDIDRIDEAMHRLLIERSRIIDRLIAVKRTEKSGSAFRPAREADMMRRIVQRHEGLLPLDTVEGIWRVIISTFTYVQAPYAVHADISAGEAAMRDSVRFHFGFTVPYKPALDPRTVIAAVATSRGDLGLVRAAQASGDAWWRALEAPGAPKIIARLPFLDRADHPAALPVYVVAKPLSEATSTDVNVYSARVSLWSRDATEILAQRGAEAAVAFDALGGADLLLSVRGEVAPEALIADLRTDGIEITRMLPVGSHTAPHVVTPA